MDDAVEVFWQKGFDGASLDDLTAAMKINRPSLYGTFGGKTQLYLKTLERYGSGIGSKAMLAFLDEPDIRKAVEKFLTVSLECQTRSGNLAKGCLLANCAVTTIDTVPETQSLLLEMSEKSRSLIVDRFKAEIKSRMLSSSFRCAERADWLLDFVQAQAYRARIGESREKIREGILSKVDMILG